MNALEILSVAERLGLTLRADGDSLVVRGPQGVIGSDLRQAIQARKADLLAVLNDGPTNASIRRRPEGTAPVLSAGQERLWFLEQWSAQRGEKSAETGDATRARYNVQASVRIRGTVIPALLRRSLDAIVARHEVLRTAIEEVDGAPRAKLLARVETPWTFTDLSDLAPPSRAVALRSLARDTGRAPFALDAAPLLRAALVKLATDEHVLVLTQHHIATDGASMSLLLGELAAFYRAFLVGGSPALRPLPIQYADHAAFQRASLAGARGRALESFWRARLAGLPRLELPTPLPAPRTRTSRGASHRFTIPAATVGALKTLARAHECTLFAGLLASFATLLHRYSGQTDFGVGTVVAGRDRRELAPLLGFFVNTLVLRCDLTGNPSFAQLLGRAGATTREAFEHQALPFDAIVNVAAAPRSGELDPLVQASVVLESPRPAVATVADATWSTELDEVDGSIEGGAKFDLSLVCVERDGGLDASLEYSADLYDAAWIARMAQHFVALVASLVAEPERPASEAPYLDATETAFLVHGCNATSAPLPTACVHELFEQQAGARPGAIAIVSGDEQVTYADLNERANRLASYLRGRGALPDQRIAIAMEPSVDRIVAVLAVLKAGAAFLPLDCDHPPERLAFTLSDAGTSLLLTSRRVADRFDGVRIPVVVVEDVHAALEQEPAADAASLASLDHLAYVIYTSGSTGTPKGVLLGHRGLSNLVAELRSTLSLGPGSRVLHFASFAFDASVWEIHATLTSGATLYVAPRAQILPGTDLAAFVSTHHISHALLSASALAVMEPEHVPSLTTLATGGEACPEALAEKWARGRMLFNAYGPTEATVCVTLSRWSETDPRWTLGGPIANTRILVLDAFRQLVPSGVHGELCIGGIGLARGYVNRPELDAGVFVDDPFSGVPGARLYRTGDLVRRLPNGALEFLGRRDDQVKIRGFRIELGEIEARLSRRPGVRGVAVLAREDRPGDKRLVAYVVGDVPASDLKASLGRALPTYMIPDAFVALDALPLTSNGKVDRKALPVPDRAGAASTYAPPTTPAEEALVSIWSELLAVPRVGIDDSFFELGGHSLLATRAVSRIRRALDVDLSVRELFDAPTVRALALVLASRASSPRAPALIRVDRSAPQPASHAQARLWFLDALEPGLSTYNIPGAFRLQGPLHVGAFTRAVADLVARHESLRTTFAEVDGRPVQIIGAPTTSIPVLEDDLSLLSEATRSAEVERRIHAEATTPFSLARGPLIRVRLLRCAANDHVLLLTMHHIVSDGWSVGVLLNELSVAYAARARGEAPALTPLAYDYVDFAALERTAARIAASDDAVAFHARALAGAVPIELPTDRPRPARPSHRGASLPVFVPAAVVEPLRQLAQSRGVTLFMVLVAAYDVLLARLTGQTDLTVGTALANRSLPELEATIGFFVGTVALRSDLSDDPTFDTLLSRVRETTLGAFAHGDVPFERVVQAVETARDPSRTPVVQTMFVLQNAELPKTLGLLSLEAIPFAHATAKFELTWALQERADGLVGDVEYANDLFDASTVARWSDHFVSLLETIAKDPEARVSALDVLRPDERDRLLTEWNATEAPLPEAPVHRLFEARVATDPQAIALVFEGQQVSYAELNARANRLAHRLATLGLQRDQLVGIALERSAEMIVAALAVLKSGAAYVPLDPAYPVDRLDYMLADSGARALVTTRPLVGRFTPHAVPTLLVDEEADALASQSAENPSCDVVLSDLAYAIYTSGSTGRPKGALLEHRGVAAFTQAQLAALSIGPGRRVLQFASFSFDASVWEIFLALCGGATLYLARRDDLLPGADLARFVATHGIDTALLPPSALTVMEPEALEPITTLVLAGEACPEALAERFAAGRRLFNAYGPTEATVYVTLDEWSADAPRWSLGRAIANTRIYILDRHGRPAPMGVAGEICVAGIGVGRGYLGQPELTAARFTADPFTAIGARMYRTGDLGRFLPNGDVEYLGRLDHQVKIRGYRIELGEIESLLARMPGVRACAVLVREDVAGDKRIVAYVVGEADAATLSGDLAARLPSYMVPSAFVSLAAIPLTSNGKVDRRALPAPHRGSVATTFCAPETETQIVLARLWCDVIGVTRVGVDDSFFELGGHSLLATQVVARVRRTFDVEVPLRALFEKPTVRGLERAIVNARRTAEAPLVPAPRTSPIPLSFAQRRLWVLEQIAPGLSTYNVSAALRMHGPLDVPALGRALDAIVDRHEVLRTTFADTAGQTVQVVHPSAPGILQVEALAADSSPDVIFQRAREEANVPFVLTEGPLFRARLLRLDEADHVLVITMHHIVSDGWSVGILVRELTSLYRSFLHATPSTLPDLPIQYADYAVWEGALGTDDAALAFWKDTLSGCQPLDLPTDRPRPPVQTHQSATARFTVSARVTRALHDLARAHSATLFMVLLAAYQVLLARLSGQSDVTVGTPIANRRRSELASLIGFFVNTLVLRADVADDAPFSSFLERVRDGALAAYARQDTPFEQVVQALGAPRDTSRTPLFQTMFALQSAPAGDLALDGVGLTPLPLENDTAKFDLTWSLEENAAGLSGSVEYAAELWDASTLDRWLGCFVCLLEHLAASPDTRVSQLLLLRPSETRALVARAGSAEVPLLDACIHHRFETHAFLRPEDVALVFGDERVTYGDLNVRANRLAHHLCAQGAEPDALIAIALPSSVERIVAVLAVLKAGAAYLPLDPDYPEERLAFMVADSGARTLVTTAELLPRFGAASTPHVLLDRDAPSLASMPATNPAVVVEARSLAYAIYTSGSTGQPKGVLIEHRGLVNLVAALNEALAIDAGAQVLQFASFAFDASVWDMHTALAAGATLHLGRREELLPGPDLTAFLRARGITHALLPASALAAMSPDDLPTLTTLATGGEACPEPLAQRWAKGRALFNAYGPTEATVCVTLARFSDTAPRWTLGRPIANTRVHVLDRHGRPVPIGIAGELCIGGVGLARGYRGRPDLDAAKFVLDPFSDGSGARLYRTGDLARVRADGNLEFLGRMDDQVKIRGHRIELGEIEATLLAHPAVESAVVSAREDVPGDKRLVAYVVGARVPEASALRAFVARTLPAFMIPSAFVALPSLPVTRSGKVDRKALPPPEVMATPNASAPPRSAMEQLVARIWSEELGGSPGRDDQFFEIGGHSLAAVRVAQKLRAALGRDVPVVALFREPVLKRFAEQLDQRPAAPPALAEVKQQAAKQSAAIKRFGRDGRGSRK